MRSPANALGAVLRQATQENRERLAFDIYAPEAVRTRLTDAAAKGFDQATIAGPEGIDLRETAAAKAAVAWLTEMKLDQMWETRGGAAASTYDLVVSWQPRTV